MNKKKKKRILFKKTVTVKVEITLHFFLAKDFQRLVAVIYTNYFLADD